MLTNCSPLATTTDNNNNAIESFWTTLNKLVPLLKRLILHIHGHLYKNGLSLTQDCMYSETRPVVYCRRVVCIYTLYTGMQTYFK